MKSCEEEIRLDQVGIHRRGLVSESGTRVGGKTAEAASSSRRTSHQVYKAHELLTSFWFACVMFVLGSHATWYTYKLGAADGREVEGGRALLRMQSGGTSDSRLQKRLDEGWRTEVGSAILKICESGNLFHGGETAYWRTHSPKFLVPVSVLASTYKLGIESIMTAPRGKLGIESIMLTYSRPRAIDFALFSTSLQ